MDFSAGLLPTVSRILRIASLVLVVFLGANSLLAPPKPTAVGIDQVVYSLTLERMRGGHDYYTAMTDGLTQVYGPPVAVRDFRLPTLFLLLEKVPQAGLWAAFVAMATTAGVVAVWGSPGGLVGPLVSSYLLGIGRASTAFGVTDQFLTVELWVAPLVLLSVIAILASRPGIAVVAALAGFSIREHVALLLASALVFAWIRGKKRLVLAASGVGGLLTAIHIVAARRRIRCKRQSHLL